MPTATQHQLLLVDHLSKFNLKAPPMSRRHETNPHFRPPQQLPQQPIHPDTAIAFPTHQRPRSQPQTSQPPQGDDDYGVNFPIHDQPLRHHHGTDHFPLHLQQQQPQPPRQQQPKSRRTPPPQQPQQPLQSQSQVPPQLPPQQQQPKPPQQQAQPDQHQSTRPQPPPPLNLPSPKTTRPITWFIGIFCALFWIIIIIGGLAILLVYLLFRPRSPKFDISSASLNAAYLDMGYLLNADLTLLANFTNPSKKVSVDFSYIVIDLYYQGNPIATRYIDPFSVMRTGSRFSGVEMVTSQVRLSIDHSQRLQREMNSGRVRFEVRGLFRARSNLGGFLRYSYWLYGHCDIVVTSPPSGVLVAKKCRTKR